MRLTLPADSHSNWRLRHIASVSQISGRIRQMPPTFFDLQGARALVTGGTGVLGRETALALARANANVAVLGRDKFRLSKSASIIESTGAETLQIMADVTNAGDLDDVRKVIASEWGSLDILVNAAGGHILDAIANDPGELTDIKESALQDVYD